MWRQLNPAERAKLLGTLLLSISLGSVAAALGYFAFTLNRAQEQLPAILAQVEQTTNRIDPILQEIAATRAAIPPILNEVAAVRRQIPSVLDEVAAVRKQIPPLLAEVAHTRKVLPPLFENTAKSIHDVNTTVQTLEPYIPQILAEVKLTREAMPGLLTRAENLVAGASKVGQEASKGAVLGFFGGIISAPFKIIGGIGKEFSESIGLSKEKGFTDKDIKLAEQATNDALRTGNIGTEVKWENPDNNNHGTVTLLEQRSYDEQRCYLLRYAANSADGEVDDRNVELCQDKDGNWTQRQ